MHTSFSISEKINYKDFNIAVNVPPIHYIEHKCEDDNLSLLIKKIIGHIDDSSISAEEIVNLIRYPHRTKRARSNN